MTLAINTISGQIADVSPKMLEHPAFKDILRIVEDGTKPYVAELYTPGTVQEKSARGIKVDFGDVKVTKTPTDTKEEI